jgi:hypothetical protein
MQNRIDEKIELGEKIRVWIGDPCYVIPDEMWKSVCDQIFAGTEREVNHVIKFEFRDLREAGVSGAMLDSCACRKLAFVQCGTDYGDGEYPSDSGFCYGVDAGCLAAVPDYLIDPKKMERAERLGKFFDAVDYIALRTDGNGEFVFYDAMGILEIIETGDE